MASWSVVSPAIFQNFSNTCEQLPRSATIDLTSWLEVKTRIFFTSTSCFIWAECKQNQKKLLSTHVSFTFSRRFKMESSAVRSRGESFQTYSKEVIGKCKTWKWEKLPVTTKKWNFLGWNFQPVNYVESNSFVFSFKLIYSIHFHWCCISYRNQSFDLLFKSSDWFPHECKTGIKWVKNCCLNISEIS